MSIRIKVTIAFVVSCLLLGWVLQNSYGGFQEMQREMSLSRALSRQRTAVLEVARLTDRFLDEPELTRQLRDEVRACTERSRELRVSDHAARSDATRLVIDFAKATQALLDRRDEQNKALAAGVESLSAWIRARDDVLAVAAGLDRLSAQLDVLRSAPFEAIPRRRTLARLVEGIDPERTRRTRDELASIGRSVREALSTARDRAAQLSLDPEKAQAVRESIEWALGRFDQWSRDADTLIASTTRVEDAYATEDTRIEPAVQALDDLALVSGSRVTEVVDQFRKVQSRLTIAVVIAIASIVLLVWSQIVRLRRTARLMRSIAEDQGDLTQRLEVKQRDEIGEVAYWFNVFVERIQQMLRGLGFVTRELDTASRDLSKISVELSETSRGNTEQAKRLATTAAAVSEDVQRATIGVGELGKQYKQVTGSSKTASEFSTNAVGASQSVDEIVRRLSETCAEVGEVINLISSIARQTNLLAINAAIEAARAGAAGQGFAVVAEEVRRLATDTSQGADSVSHQLGSIQVDSQTAVAAVSEVAEVIHRVHDLQSSIATIVDGQSDLAHIVLESMESVASGSLEIHNATKTVAIGTESTHELADNTQQASNRLRTMAKNLGELVAQFRC